MSEVGRNKRSSYAEESCYDKSAGFIVPGVQKLGDETGNKADDNCPNEADSDGPLLAATCVQQNKGEQNDTAARHQPSHILLCVPQLRFETFKPDIHHFREPVFESHRTS